MIADFWQRAQHIFEQAVSAPSSDRKALLDTLCAEDPALREEVESLLSHDDAKDDFLTPPSAVLSLHNDPEAAWAASLVGETVGRFRVQRLLAVGGMGMVFEVMQDRPSRAVALKILKPGFSAPNALARFRLEPEVLGRLQHPNIAQVLEAGVHDGEHGPLPYFAMELIPQAQPLIEFAANRELSTRDRLALFAKICDAVHHGHQKGVIHRDLKPANILVGANGEPKVIDFGVARSTDSDIMATTQCTNSGDLIGTIRYMSPEQCDGDATTIDTRTDVYSLGVVLYELLTGAAPYRTAGTTLFSAIQAIKIEPPRPMAEFGRQFRGDIEAILFMAMEKSPSRRYGSAADMARDIRCHLAGESLEARPPGKLQKIIKWAVRHAGWTTLAASLLVIAIAGAATWWATAWYARYRPDHVAIATDEKTVELRTAAGKTLRTWESPGGAEVKFAALADRPAELGGGQVAVIAYWLTQNEPFYAQLCINEVNGDARNNRVVQIQEEDIPSHLMARNEGNSNRPYTTGRFPPEQVLLADVFDYPPGVEADEIVVAFRQYESTQTALRIHALDGTPLYQVWMDVDVYDMHYLPQARQLVLAGNNGEAYFSEREVSPPYSVRSNYPIVIFAVQPRLNFITKQYLAQESCLRDSAPRELRPCWYHMVSPLAMYDHIIFERHASLESPSTPYSGGESAQFNLVVEAKKEGELSERINTSRSWQLFPDGRVLDRDPIDQWKLYGSTPEHPDRPLPPFDAFYLGPLTPAKDISKLDPPHEDAAERARAYRERSRE